ncbi:MAG: PP2C family protein-serine/threonine phosphatase [Planctomycetaceae bacterium]
MADTVGENPEANLHTLQCMELWTGNSSVESMASSTGLEAWIFSQPYQGESTGGDVHYLSLCVGGIVTRILLADVSGHGIKVDATSNILKKLLRRFMNAKRQDRLVEELNREFSGLEQSGRFATAVIATYLSHKNRLLLTNAGHPRPLLFRKSVGRWQYLSHVGADEQTGNLPLGIDDSTRYEHAALQIESGDMLLLYTDAFTEAGTDHLQLLGEPGLLSLAESIPQTDSIDQFGRKLVNAVRDFAGGSANDDETLIVIRFGEGRKSPGLLERLRGYSAVLRG